MSTDQFLRRLIRSIIRNRRRSRSRLALIDLSFSCLTSQSVWLSGIVVGMAVFTSSNNHLFPTDNTYPITQSPHILLGRIRILSIHIPCSTSITYQIAYAGDERSECHPDVAEDMEGYTVIEEDYRKECKVCQEFGKIYQVSLPTTSSGDVKVRTYQLLDQCKTYTYSSSPTLAHLPFP